MNVLAEVLAPGVQDQGDADLPADPMRIAAEGQERVRRRREEEAVEAPRVALDQRVEGVRQREHDMVVVNTTWSWRAARSSPRRASTHRSSASVWHLGQ